MKKLILFTFISIALGSQVFGMDRTPGSPSRTFRLNRNSDVGPARRDRNGFLIRAGYHNPGRGQNGVPRTPGTPVPGTPVMVGSPRTPIGDIIFYQDAPCAPKKKKKPARRLNF